jgi:hypothetical protein
VGRYDLSHGTAGHREHHHIGAAERFADRHHRGAARAVPGTGAGAVGHVVPGRTPPLAERAADFPGSDYCDLHACSYRVALSAMVEGSVRGFTARTGIASVSLRSSEAKLRRRKPCYPYLGFGWRHDGSSTRARRALRYR